MARAPLLILIATALIALVSVTAAFILAPHSDCRDFSAGTVTFNNNQQLSVALARTATEHQQGLSGCQSLASGQGMYFIFPSKTSLAFWMKDMLMPLDLVWLADNTVVGITANVPPPASPEEPLPLYPAPVPIDGVLEIGAGEAQRLNIRQGTILEISY